MRVQHNIAAMNAYRNYNNNTSSINKNLEKLSSGYRINRAGDDAAGLAISEKMRAQITGISTAQKNAKDGISLVQTAEGALTEVHSMLNRMYELAEQSANGTYAGSDSTGGSPASKIDRDQLQKEVTALRDEINRIAGTANFNGIQLFTGTGSGSDISATFTDTGTGFTGATASGLPTDFDGKTLTLSSSDGSTWDVTGGPSGYTGTVSGSTISFVDASGASAGSITLTGTGDPTGGGTATIALSSSSAAAGGAAAGGAAAGGAATGGAAAGGIPAGSIVLQIGDENTAANQLTLPSMDMSESTLKIDSSSVDVSTQNAALTSLANIKDAINTVSGYRGDLGAMQNRLEHTISNLSVMKENMQDAESTIRDTDVADEMMKYTKNSILVQSAQAMLAQANQQPQGVLQLLQ